MCVNGRNSPKWEESIVSDIPIKQVEMRNWWLRPENRTRMKRYSTTVCWADGSIMRSRLKRRRLKYKEGQRKGHKETEERTPLDGGAAVTWRQRCREASGQFESEKSASKKGQITVMTRGAIQPRGAMLNKPKHASDTEWCFPSLLTLMWCLLG